MNIHKIKQEIKEIFSQKEISLSTYKYGLRLLKEISNVEEEKEFYYNAMGKLLLKQNDFEAAEYLFLEQLECNPNSQSIYYNLYKINVHKANFIDAYLNLFEYQNRGNKEKTDITFPLALLEMMLTLNHNPQLFFETNYEIPLTSRLYTFPFCKEVDSIYHKIIENFNQREFREMKKNLLLLNNLVLLKNLHVDITTLITLSDMLIHKVNAINIEKPLEKRKIDISFKNYMLDDVKKRNFSEKKLLNFIDIAIDKDPIFSEKLLSEVMTTFHSDFSQDEYHYLISKINEKKYYMTLDSTTKIAYNTHKLRGRKAYQKRCYDEAIIHFKTGKSITGHPIFDYYIGKALFKNHDFLESYEYLSSYIEHGGEKLLKALLYITVIESTIFYRNNKQIHKRIIKADKIKSTFNRYKDWISYEKNFYQGKITKNNKNNFSLSEIDFKNYENYTITEKLRIIKKLYQGNYIYLADDLMKKLESNTINEEDKKNIDYEKKMKVLYLNQVK